MMNSKEYRANVMGAYFHDYGGSAVFHYLEDPSEKRIMYAAIDLLEIEKRYKDDDKDILNNFLNLDREGDYIRYFREKDFVKAFRNHSKGKYKNIVTFIKRYKENPTRKTDPIYMDFIAWLIDYNPRPRSVLFYPRFKERKLKELSKGIQEVLKSEKERLIMKHLLFNEGMLTSFKEKVLSKVLKDL